MSIVSILLSYSWQESKRVYWASEKVSHFHLKSSCDDSTAHSSYGAAAVLSVRCLVCTAIWHHSHCETNTPIPLGLSWRSCGVATFPMPLWASQSSRDPSGQRGSSAWELERSQTHSPANSQQKEPDKTRRPNTEKHWLRPTVGFPGLLVSSRQSLCVGAPCLTASDAQCDVGVMCWSGVDTSHTHTHTLVRNGTQQV